MKAVIWRLETCFVHAFCKDLSLTFPIPTVVSWCSCFFSTLECGVHSFCGDLTGDMFNIDIGDIWVTYTDHVYFYILLLFDAEIYFHLIRCVPTAAGLPSYIHDPRPTNTEIPKLTVTWQPELAQWILSDMLFHFINVLAHMPKTLTC